jgi:hypothetical protein
VRCFAVSSQSEERSFGDGLLSATGLARRVGASIRVHKSPRGGSRDIRPFVGGSGCHRPWVFSLMVVPGTRATSTPTAWHACSLQPFNAIICLAPARYRWCDSEQWVVTCVVYVT